MKAAEVILAVLLPPLAVALRPGTTAFQVVLCFMLWVFGWVPGAIYAFWLINADRRQLRDAKIGAALTSAPSRRRQAA